jgi:hypothetical protein
VKDLQAIQNTSIRGKNHLKKANKNKPKKTSNLYAPLDNPLTIIVPVLLGTCVN